MIPWIYLKFYLSIIDAKNMDEVIQELLSPKWSEELGQVGRGRDEKRRFFFYVSEILYK